MPPRTRAPCPSKAVPSSAPAAGQCRRARAPGAHRGEAYTQRAHSEAGTVALLAHGGPPTHVRNFGCNSQIQGEIHAEHLSLLGKLLKRRPRIVKSNDLATPLDMSVW